jgi:hypothetical protein
MLWDAAVSGFHARRQRGPAVMYAVFYRTKDGLYHNPWLAYCL